MTQRLTPVERVIELNDMIDAGLARELRVSSGLSLAVIGRDCGDVTPGAVLRWEQGERRPRGRNIDAYWACLTRLKALALPGTP